jgi:competence protein ComEC
MKFWKYIHFLLLLTLGLIIVAGLQLPDSKLHIIACDVGQGDATLVTHENSQVLIDGGPDSKVLDCLGRYMPFWDRGIELVILTHPDRDHFQGLVEVVKRYKVDTYLYNPVTISKLEYKVLEKEVGRRDLKGIYPHSGQVIRVGMIQLDILAPFEQVTNENNYGSTGEEVKEVDTNAYSIVSLISFGKFSALLTGDMTKETSDDLVASNAIKSVNYIKIPHHGSKNGLTENLLKALRPNTATISVSKNNIYGHPHDEIIKMLSDLNVEIYRTDEVGNIEITTDGEKYWVEK